MSQDHHPSVDQRVPATENNVVESDAVVRGEAPAVADPMEVLIQASQAAESLQCRFTELQALQAEISGKRDQLTADRIAFETRSSEFAEHVARERLEQRRIREELDEENRRVKQWAESLEKDHGQTLQSDKQLKAERVLLQQAVKDELASDRQSLLAEQEGLENERAALARQQTALEVSFKERQQQAEEQLNVERDALREKIREELNSDFSQLSRERQEWNDRYQLEFGQLRDKTENLQQQRTLLDEQISAEQSRLRNELEKQRQALLTEQTNLQRQYQFQFEHLARTRNDFENEVRHLRRDQQCFQAERQRFQEQHRMQLVKLSRVRELMEEREASLKREKRVIECTRTAAQTDLQRQQEQLQEDRDSVNNDLEERTRQVRMREESISKSSQRLAEKTQQLNRLQSDLDAQHRDLLELRIIMEEIQGDLQKQHSAAELVRRQQQARDSLVSFFDELHQRIRDERQELERQVIQLEENRNAFRCDREQLEQWFEQNQAVLKAPVSESHSEPSVELLAVREELDRLRNEWVADLSHSEAKLRLALAELETLQRSGFFQNPSEESEEDSQRTAA